MSDKDVDGIIRALASSRALHRATVVCTKVPGARALRADELARRWSELAPSVATVRPIESPPEALDAALRDAHGPVVVAGSLYLVGDVRARLVDDPLLRDPIASTT
jgi:folylpolyglutamate synthase/dihydropteroate synthase